AARALAEKVMHSVPTPDERWAQRFGLSYNAQKEGVKACSKCTSTDEQTGNVDYDQEEREEKLGLIKHGQVFEGIAEVDGGELWRDHEAHVRGSGEHYQA